MSRTPAPRMLGLPFARSVVEPDGSLSMPVSQTFPAFNPISAINWEAAFWASDPLWANPGDGNKVSSWRDGSGNARDLSQNTDANRPVYKANHPSLNNQPAVEFTKADVHRLVSGTFTVNQPNTWVSIFRFTDQVTDSFGRLIDNQGLAGSIPNRQLFGGWTTTQFVAFAGSVVTFTKTPDLMPTIGLFYANGSTSWIEINRVRSGNLNANTRGVGSIGIGSDGGTSHLSAAVAFVGLYSGDVTTHRNWTAMQRWAERTYRIGG